MNDRKITVGAIVVIALIVLAAAYIVVERRNIIAQQETRNERWISSMFQKIQLVRGRALLIPAPIDESVSIPRKLYFLSNQEKGYWKKPKFAYLGLGFGFFDGSMEYTYRVIDVQPDGINLQYDYSASPPRSANEPLPIVILRWK